MRKVEQFLIGGRMFFEAVQNPALAVGSAGAKKASAELVSEDIFKDLVLKGITSDVNKFTDMLVGVERAYKFSSVPQSVMYKIKAEANRVIQNANNLSTAEKEATKNGALSDMAVDDKGYMFIRNEKTGNVERKHISEYKADKDYGLTVGELINLRKNDDNLANADFISTVVKKSVGTERINKFILDIIQTVGTTFDSQEAYKELAGIVGTEMAKKPSALQQQGIKDMYEAISQYGSLQGALFHTKDTLQSKNIQEGLSYIYSMLPNNMRKQLEANFVGQGGKYEKSQEHIWQLIGTALSAANDTKDIFEIDYQKEINEAAGTRAGKAASEKQNQLTPLEMLVNGDLGQVELPITNAKRPNLQMKLKGNGMPTFTDVNGKPTGKMILTDMMTSALSTMVDQTHMQIGDQKINPQLLQNIVYNGGDVVNVWAPLDSQGNADLGLLSRLQAVQDHIKNNEDVLSVEDKNALLAQEGVPGHYDEQGNYIPDQSNMGQFIVFTGITTEKFDPADSDINDFTYKLKRDETDGLKEELKTIYGKSNGKYGNQKFPFSFFTAATTYVAAPVFMRVNQNAQQYAGAYAGHGPAVSRPTLQQQMSVEQRLNSNYLMPSSSFFLN